VDLRQLRYFVAVAEELHFGRAAERLGIAQPGLSQQIKLLERHLRVSLFVRSTRGVELTEAGNILLGQANKVIELADRAVQTTRRSVVGKKGVLKVGATMSGLHGAATAIVKEFRARHPDVDLEVHADFVSRNVEALSRHVLDVAFVIRPFNASSSVNYRRLGERELLLAVPEGNPLSLLERIPRSALLNVPFLDWPTNIDPPLVGHIHSLLFGAAEHPDKVEVPDGTELTRALLVAEGKGVGVITYPLTKLRIRGIAVRRIEEPAPVVEFGIAWRQGDLSSFAREFLAIADEHVEPVQTADGLEEANVPSP
jgi:DNA-binding transcriptional LysR family regulator